MSADAKVAARVLLSPPDTGEHEIEYVVAAMRSGWVAPAGPDLAAFEEAVAARCEVPHAVALSSGTAALHLALTSWGVGVGDVVVTSSLTFAATANAIAYTGAQPHFVDCDERTGNVTAELLARAIEQVRSDGGHVAALLPVDMLGKCVDYRAVTQLAGEHGLPLMCDAAEAFGSASRGLPAGGAGDASVLSFNGNKIMTTSGGGMLVTRDGPLAERVRYLSTQARQPVDHYEHEDVGYNYRLSNILAALGRAQLARLDSMISVRRRWREAYRALLSEIDGVRIIGGEQDTEDNCWLTAITIDPSIAGTDRLTVSRQLDLAGIETRPVWKPMHLQPVFRSATTTLTGAADRLFEQGLTLPSGSAMGESDFDRVLSALSDALRKRP